MYNIIYEMSRQSRFDAGYWMLGAGALGRPRGMVWGGRREEGSGWGTHIYLWQIHFDIWQNQSNIVKLNKIKILKNDKKREINELALDIVPVFHVMTILKLYIVPLVSLVEKENLVLDPVQNFTLNLLCFFNFP